jgi:hypothetical protein
MAISLDPKFPMFCAIKMRRRTLKSNRTIDQSGLSNEYSSLIISTSLPTSTMHATRFACIQPGRATRGFRMSAGGSKANILVKHVGFHVVLSSTLLCEWRVSVTRSGHHARMVYMCSVIETVVISWNARADTIGFVWTLKCMSMELYLLPYHVAQHQNK